MAREKIYLFDHSPHLRGEWDYILNKGIDPNTVSHGAGLEVWWRCSENHSWKMKVAYRLRGGRCLECVPRRKNFSDDIKSVYDNTSSNFGRYSLWNTHPELCLQWDDPELSPDMVTRGYSKPVRWKCFLGHKWESTISTRVTTKGGATGCPYCAGRGRYKRVLAGFNDLRSLNPELAVEMDDLSISSSELLQFSTKKVRWKCPKGHSFIATPAQRSFGSYCPECPRNTSKVETRLRDIIGLDQKYRLKSSQKINIPWRGNRHMMVDIHGIFDSAKFAAEYDGEYWHRNRFEVDVEKTEALLKGGYLCIRVRENDLPHLDLNHPNLFQLSVPYSTKDDHLIEAVEKIKHWLDEKTTNDIMV